jgi:SAM-dependent methyltransferase
VRQAKHPAKFNDAVLDAMAAWLPHGALVLDPFAGVGKLKQIPSIVAVRVEIERDWADNVCADALHLPFRDETFDAVATSPVFGNRMSDSHNARDASKRHTYKHYLGHDLHPHNAGQLQWSDGYRFFHRMAWTEVIRCLKPGGLFLLNCSDHIRKGQRMNVTAWHEMTLQRLGLVHVRTVPIATARLRHGENHGVRVGHETLSIFTKGATR